jgi:hypothetical protein
MIIPAEEGQLHLGFVHSDYKGQAGKNRNVQITQMGSIKTNTGYYSYWKDLRPLVKPQMLSETIKFFKKRNVLR